MKREQISDLLVKLYLLTIVGSAVILIVWLLQPYLGLQAQPSLLFGYFGAIIGLLGVAWALEREVRNPPGV